MIQNSKLPRVQKFNRGETNAKNTENAKKRRQITWPFNLFLSNSFHWPQLLYRNRCAGWSRRCKGFGDKAFKHNRYTVFGQAFSQKGCDHAASRGFWSNFSQKFVSSFFWKRLWNLGVVILLNNLARYILNFKLVATNYKYINYFNTYGPKTKKPPIFMYVSMRVS